MNSKRKALQKAWVGWRSNLCTLCSNNQIEDETLWNHNHRFFNCRVKRLLLIKVNGSTVYFWWRKNVFLLVLLQKLNLKNESFITCVHLYKKQTYIQKYSGTHETSWERTKLLYFLQINLIIIMQTCLKEKANCISTDTSNTDDDDESGRPRSVPTEERKTSGESLYVKQKRVRLSVG